GNSTVHFADKLAEASSVSQAFRMRDVWELDKLAWAALMVAYPFRRTIVKHVLKRRFNRAEQVEVNLRRLSDVLREKNVDQIDLLKIDVEGAEFEVLDGLEPADWERVRQLVMEIAPANVTKIHAFAQDLQQRGFTSVSVIDAFGNSIQPTPHQQHNGLPMILCARCL
ncbi:MAG: FkbM family methyltransferase, partial [Planctomycetota bacterium]